MKNWLVQTSDDTKKQIKLPRVLPQNQRFCVEVDGNVLEVSFDLQHRSLKVYEGELERIFSLCHFELEQFPSDPETTVKFSFSNKPSVFFTATLQSYVPGFEGRKKAGAADGSLVRSPITGKVLAVNLEPGNSVVKGDCVLVVEAMKMENKIFAPQSGVLAELKVAEGDSVGTGAPLFLVKND